MPRRGPDKSLREPPALAKANALWGEQRYDEALRQFNAAVREAPDNFRVLIEAARALGLRYQLARSMSLLERALRLGSRRFEVQHAVGESYRRLGRMAEAEACFRRACRLATNAESRLELAHLCERRHALDEAAELVDAVLRANPRSPAALLLRGRIERRRGVHEHAGNTLQQLVALAGLPPKLLAEAYGELSAVLDEAGDYDAAWEATLRGKQVLLPHADAAWAASQFVLSRCGRMIDALTPAHFARWSPAAQTASRGRQAAEFESPSRSHRLALLTGFPRSGTTLLERVLDAHPQVVSVEEKEVFSADVFPFLGAGRPANASIVEILDELTPERTAAARQMYLGAMESLAGEPLAGRLLVDKNPAMNLMIPPLRRVFPEARLVVALRDPRDVVVSAFMRYLPINPVSVSFLSLERTVDRYVFDMQAWLALRDMIGDWVEVRYEDLVADLPAVARRVLAALELPWDDAVLAYRTSAKARTVASPTYEAVAKPVYATALGRWRHYERQLAPLLDQLAPTVAALGYDS